MTPDQIVQRGEVTPTAFVSHLLTLDEETRREALRGMLLESLDLPYEDRKPLVEHMLGLPWSEFKKICVVRNGVLQKLDADTQMRLMERHLPLLKDLDPGLASRDFHYVREFRQSLAPEEAARLDQIAVESGVASEVCR